MDSVSEMILEFIFDARGFVLMIAERNRQSWPHALLCLCTALAQGRR